MLFLSIKVIRSIRYLNVSMIDVIGSGHVNPYA